MRFLLVIGAVLVGLIAAFALLPRARLIFPEYDQAKRIDEFYFWREFISPSACEEGLSHYRALPGQTTPPAQCRYAPRLYVWGLTARYILHRLAGEAGV
jgi:hypothetical protein